MLAERYRVEHVIGTGGMGVVAAAEHLILGQRVAIKFLLPETTIEKDVVSRFLREARAVSRLHNSHVARVMDVGSLDNGAPYIVMEYLEGRDLASELAERGALPISEAVGYVLQAMIGVAEAHSLGIVHRDLKPSNLFLTRLANGRPLIKVLDFGIAKQLTEGNEGQITKTYVTLGSAAYMSPEQVRRARSVDLRTDVWAFGIVLFELLTDSLPFEGESPLALASAITADTPTRLRERRPDAPEELEAVIMRCLERDREQRTPSLAALAAELVPFGGRNAAVLAGQVADALGTDDAEAPEARASLPSSSELSGEIASARSADARIRSSQELASAPTQAAPALEPLASPPAEVARPSDVEPAVPSWARTHAGTSPRFSALLRRRVGYVLAAAAVIGLVAFLLTRQSTPVSEQPPASLRETAAPALVTQAPSPTPAPAKLERAEPTPPPSAEPVATVKPVVAATATSTARSTSVRSTSTSRPQTTATPQSTASSQPTPPPRKPFRKSL